MIEKWDKVDLKLNDKDDSYFKDTKVLFDDLENQIKKFEEEKEKSHKFSELKKIKSPIAILNGKWGSGKTYFLEHFLENFEAFKTSANANDLTINDYKYIDALDLIDDENIVLDFMIQLFSDSKFIEGAKTFGKEFMRFGRNSMADIMNYIPGINFDKKNKAEELSTQNKIDLINNFAETRKSQLGGKRILIIIDNLERIGNDSKKIMKLLYRLRQVDGFVFLVVANITKLVEFENDSDEYPIYKFINLKPYNLIQNYVSALASFIGDKVIEENELSIINNALNKNDGKRLVSIRELTSWVKSSNYFENDSLMKRLKLFNEFNLKWNGIAINDEFSKIYNDQITKIITDLRDMCLKLNEIEIMDEHGIVDSNDESYGEYNGFVYNKIDNSLYKKDGTKIFSIHGKAYAISSPNSRWNHEGANLALSQLSEIALKVSENNYKLSFEEISSIIKEIEFNDVDETILGELYNVVTNKNQNITNSGYVFKTFIDNKDFIQNTLTNLEDYNSKILNSIASQKIEIEKMKEDLSELNDYDEALEQCTIAKEKIEEIEEQISQLSSDDDDARRSLLLDKEHQKAIVDKFNGLPLVEEHNVKMEELQSQIETKETLLKKLLLSRGEIENGKLIPILNQMNKYIETYIELYNKIIEQNDKELIPTDSESNVEIALDGLDVIESSHIDKYTASII